MIEVPSGDNRWGERIQLPINVVLRLSDDTLGYEWNEAAIFFNEETSRFAFDHGSGCSCSYFEEDWNEDFFKHVLVWTPRPDAVAYEAMAWVDRLNDAGERMRNRELVLKFEHEELLG